MLNTESILENETHKILWNFEIQTDNLILSRQPDLMITKKEKKKEKKREPAKQGTCPFRQTTE